MKRYKFIIFSLCLASALAACGGGGGGGSAATGTGGVVYTGATTPAVVTTTNANALAGNALGGAQTTTSLALTGAVQAAQPHAPRVTHLIPVIADKIDAITASAVKSPAPVVGAAQPVSGTQPCAVSGSVSWSGSIDNVTGSGSLTFTFSQCNDGFATMNGTLSASATVDLLSNATTAATVSFTAFTYTDPYTTVMMGGSFSETLNQTTSTRTFKANFVAQDSASGQQMKLQNYQIVQVLYPSWSTPTNYTVQLSGRIFDGAYGYVDVSTTSPLVFTTMLDPYPSSGGPVILTGNPPSQVTVQPVNATQVQISGVDGNGNAFGPTTVLWSSL